MSVDEFNGAALCLKKDQLKKIRHIKNIRPIKKIKHTKHLDILIAL